MKKYEGLVITLTNDEASYGDTGDWSLEETIDKFEDFLVEKFDGLEVCPGGDSMNGAYRVEDYPEYFNEEEFKQEMAEAWEEFCSKN